METNEKRKARTVRSTHKQTSITIMSFTEHEQCVCKSYTGQIDYTILAQDAFQNREQNVSIQVCIILELFRDSKIEQTYVHERGSVHENQNKYMEDPILFHMS